MCGLAGIVRFDGVPADPERIQAMVASLVHRGPDDSGWSVNAGVALGMRRLSIIDLSPWGHQPMVNEDGRVEVVFNGEIYNFKDLRSHLDAIGHRFRSQSDTEVLIHGYETFGAVGLATRIEGMFAIAVLDRDRRKLILIRDHFGVKPLYLRRHCGWLSFASEIRALALDGSGKPTVDPQFVGSFLRVGYVPSPFTAFYHIRKLEPGTVLEIDLDTGVERSIRYYELTPHFLDAADDGELLERLRDALHLAVRRQLVADVPVGVFLSGGLDSSTLSTLAAPHVTGALQTYSIGFSESENGDETRFAQRVASAIGASNTAIHLAPNALQDLDEIVGWLEEPLADSAVLPLWHLCRGTATHLKVSLSGEGGDEVLGGYTRYFWSPVANRISHSSNGLVRAIGRATEHLPVRAQGPWNLLRRAHKLAASLHLDESQRYLSWFDVFNAEERDAFLPGAPERISERVEGLFTRAHALGLDEVQRLQFVDFSTMLLDNLLMKSDKLSMASSLEVRVPMLDRPLAELGISLPVEAKTRGGGKPLLRRFLASEMPRSIWQRPKRGFEIPVNRWFRQTSTAEFRSRLLDGALVRTLGFSRVAVSDLLQRHQSGQDYGRKLFSLLTLELWTRRYCE